MRSTVICSAIIASVFCLAGPARADLTWGVNGHPLVSYPDVTIEQQLDYVKDLGMKSYRVDIPGPTKAPELRKLIIAAKARGIQILPVVTPDFDLDSLQPDVLQKRAYDLAFSLVSEFKHDVPVWELANEFENYAIIKPCEMRDNGVRYSCLYGDAGGADPLDYYGPRWAKVIAVLKGLTAGVRAADPTAMRAVGTAGWGHTGAFERMHKDGIEWEITVWHMYGQDPEWAFKKLVQYGKPIWITEFNHPLGSTKSEQEQADGLAKSIALLRGYQATYNVQEAHIYELLDEPYWAPNYEAYMGLVRLEKTGPDQSTVEHPKIAYERVKQLISNSGSATPQRDGQNAPENRPHCDLKSETLDRDPTPKNVIAYSYCLILDREADGAGLKGWSAKVSEGMPISDVLVTMLQSDEFANTYKVKSLSSKDYVSLIYGRLLNKTPDEKTLEKISKDIELGTLSRSDLQKSLIGSREFKTLHPILSAPLTLPPQPSAIPKQFCTLPSLRAGETTRRAQIAYGYCLVLGRKPEVFGLNSYNGAMLKGLTTSQFLTELLQSPEFQKKYGINRIDNASFVTLMFRLLLQREPDGAGLQSYVSGLNDGSLNKKQVWSAIIASEEFRNKHSSMFAAVSAAIDEASSASGPGKQ